MRLSGFLVDFLVLLFDCLHDLVLWVVNLCLFGLMHLFMIGFCLLFVCLITGLLYWIIVCTVRLVLVAACQILGTCVIIMFMCWVWYLHHSDCLLCLLGVVLCLAFGNFVVLV